MLDKTSENQFEKIAKKQFEILAHENKKYFDTERPAKIKTFCAKS